MHDLILAILLQWQLPSVAELHCVSLTAVQTERRSCYTVHRVGREAVVRAVEHRAKDTIASPSWLLNYILHFCVLGGTSHWSWRSRIPWHESFVYPVIVVLFYHPANIQIRILWRMTKNCCMLLLKEHQLSTLALSSNYCNLSDSSPREFALTGTDIQLSWRA